MSKITNILILSICIIALASCSLFKNVSNKSSCEKLRLLQQDKTLVHKEAIVISNMRTDLHTETSEPKVVSQIISLPTKSKLLVSNRLSFHRVRSASIKSITTIPTPDKENADTKVVEWGLISIASFLSSFIGLLLIGSTLSTCVFFWILGIILGIVALSSGSKLKGLAIWGIIIGAISLLLIAALISSFSNMGNGFNFI